MKYPAVKYYILRNKTGKVESNSIQPNDLNDEPWCDGGLAPPLLPVALAANAQLTGGPLAGSPS